MENNEILSAAIEYAKQGLAVFPVKQNKRPYTKHGCKDAKTDPKIIRGWWKHWPDANIGIATGSLSGNLIVVDLDVDDEKGIDGYHSLTDWEKVNGELPETWTAITGRGGYHLYFRHPNASNIGNRAGILDGVDIRGEGGYVIAPPSVHQNGSHYEWEYDPKEFRLANADATLDKLLTVGKETTGARFTVPDVIEDGQRNDTLFKMAASMQERGYADGAILSAVLAQNAASCVHPLDEAEVRQIVSSATNYKKGELKELHREGDQWRSPQFDIHTDDNGNERIRQTIDNIAEAIEWDENLWHRIRYNVLAYAPYVFGDLPWNTGNGRKFREWSNTDDSNLKSYIEKRYGFRSMDKIMEALKIVAYRHKYNPVCDLLESCLEHYDGGKHIENLLPDFLGAEKTPYTIAVMRLTMLGAISRAYYPGCKFDYTATYVGGQGIGKSTFVRYLSLNDDWFNDNFNSLDGDRAAEKLRGMWIIELAELLATKKAKEVESIKAFLTSTIDTYRPPYERRTEQRPRCCIFIGTTNSTHFLTDRTGNRRFLPIVTDGSKIKKSLFDDPATVRMEFIQAWGEAMHEFRACGRKPNLVLPKELQAEAMKMQERFLEEDYRIGMIQEFLDRYNGEKVCVKMLAKEALNMFDVKRSESNQIMDIMDNDIIGWERLRNENGGRARCGTYGSQICYVRPGSQPFAPSPATDTDDEDAIFT